jgi:hypothetical protein
MSAVRPISEEAGVNGLMTVEEVDAQLGSLRGGTTLAASVAMEYAQDRLLKRRAELAAAAQQSSAAQPASVAQEVAADAVASLRSPAEVVDVAAGTAVAAAMGVQLTGGTAEQPAVAAGQPARVDVMAYRAGAQI